MMVERLKQQETSHSSRDLLKICVKIGASWSAQTFRQAGEIPSGPEAFLDFCLMMHGHLHGFNDDSIYTQSIDI